jgi:hypothetical protein
MVMPAALISGLSSIAANEALQKAASRLVQDVYGRIMPSKKMVAIDSDLSDAISLEDVMENLRRLTTREEVAVSFGVLQATLDRRHRATLILVSAVLTMQSIALVVLIAFR